MRTAATGSRSTARQPAGARRDIPRRTQRGIAGSPPGNGRCNPRDPGIHAGRAPEHPPPGARWFQMRGAMRPVALGRPLGGVMTTAWAIPAGSGREGPGSLRARLLALALAAGSRALSDGPHQTIAPREGPWSVAAATVKWHTATGDVDGDGGRGHTQQRIESVRPIQRPSAPGTVGPVHLLSAERGAGRTRPSPGGSGRGCGARAPVGTESVRCPAAGQARRRENRLRPCLCRCRPAWPASPAHPRASAGSCCAR